MVLLVPLLLQAQEKSVFDGIRFSYDIGTIPARYIFPDQTRLEFQTDFEVKPNIYGVGEFGIFSFERSHDNFDYTQYGTFYRVGAEYNAIESKEDDILTLGGRIGTSFFSQQAANVRISSFDSIWNDVSIDQLPEKSHGVVWLEFTIGMKVELFKNIYTGWTIRGQAMLFGVKAEHLEPFYIPGFGRGNKKTAVGFNYYICYKIPLKF
jgi:hypothetical protein